MNYLSKASWYKERYLIIILPSIDVVQPSSIIDNSFHQILSNHIQQG